MNLKSIHPPTVVAGVLELMQLEGLKLTNMASKHGAHTEIGHLCLRLAQVLETGKEAMKGPFMAAMK